MNRRSSKAVVILSLMAVIIMLGCEGGSQNATPNATPNANANLDANTRKTSTNSEPEDTVALMTEPCTVDNITDGIERGLPGSPTLQNQYKKNLYFKVLPASDATGDYFNVYVSGRIYTSSDHQDQMFHFQKSVRKFIKLDCVRRVYFMTDEMFKSGAAPAAGTFFWGYCEDGKDPCSDGTCSRPCMRKKGDGTEKDG